MSDLSLARIGADSDEVLPEQICFHTQQAAEKALKAVLLRKGIEFPLIHDLEGLLEIARQGRIQLPEWAENIATLTPYAVETRYPGHWEDFSEADVIEALELAQRIVDWAKAIVSAER
jgi:HEPN domain-containing protein